MSPLYYIWSITLALAIASCFTYLVLIIRRSYHERRLKATAHSTALLRTQLFTLLDMDDAEFAKIINGHAIFPKKYQKQISELCIRLCHLIEGRNKNMLIQILINIGFDHHILNNVKKGNRDERHAAALALQYFNDEESRQALLDALYDPSEEVVFASANSLLYRGELPGLKKLLQILSTQNYLDSKYCFLLFRLIALRFPDALNQLLKSKDLSMEAKRLLAYACGFSIDFSVIKTLTKFLQIDDPQLNVLSLEAIARLEHPDAEPIITKALNSPILEVKIAAIQACGEIGLESSISKLTGLLNSENWLVRFNAAQSIYMLGDLGKELLSTFASEASRAGRISSLIMDEKNHISTLSRADYAYV